MKRFFEDETGDTNIVSLLIMIILIIVAISLFKPYLFKLIGWFASAVL